MTTTELSIKAHLQDEIKSAMRSKNELRLLILRTISAAIKQREVNEQRKLDDAEIIAVFSKEIKERRESISYFEKDGNTAKVESELASIAVIQEFLPAQADDAEIEQVISAALHDVQAQGISGAAVMGKVMAIVKEKLAGRADMSHVSKLIKQKLA